MRELYNNKIRPDRVLQLTYSMVLKMLERHLQQKRPLFDDIVGYGMKNKEKKKEKKKQKDNEDIIK